MADRNQRAGNVEMSDESKRLITSAVGLIAGNSIVDDLWSKYFRELDEHPNELYRDVLITAHVFAITGVRMRTGQFEEFISKKTDIGVQTIKQSIRSLKEAGFLRKESAETDQRIEYPRPTKKAKMLLVDMGVEYTIKMHAPIAILLGKEPEDFSDIISDIKNLMDSDINDY